MATRTSTRTDFAPTFGIGRLSVLSWLRVARERRRLARLDREQLRDIGITPEEARREISRHFWDIPAGRV